MFGLDDSCLTVHFVAPVDDQLQQCPERELWGMILKRDDVTVFVPVGSNAEFAKYFKDLAFDPVQMLMSAVASSMNAQAFELLDQVRTEEESFSLNGELFDWTDLQGARGDLGVPIVEFDDPDDQEIEI